jgi:hypothetical protein
MVPKIVIPAQAGIQRRAASAVTRLISALPRVTLDSRLRGNDGNQLLEFFR